MKLDKVEKAPDWLKQCPKTGCYYVSKYRKGLSRLEKALKDPLTVDTKMTKTRAIVLGERLIAEWLNGGKIRSREVTMSDMVDEFLSIREKKFGLGQIRKWTWHHDKTYLPLIKKWFGRYKPSEIDEDFWEDWYDNVGSLMGRTHADTSKYLSMVLTYCKRKKVIMSKPQIKVFDKPREKEALLTRGEIRELYLAAHQTLKYQIVLAFENGMRTHEARDLEWSFVKFHDGFVTLDLPERFVKSGPGREFVVSERSEAILRHLHSIKGDTVHVFPSSVKSKESTCPESYGIFYRRMRQAVTKAGLRNGTRFYLLRHGFFNEVTYEKQMPIELISNYGGNSPQTLRKAYLNGGAKETATLANLVKIDCGDSADDNEKDYTTKGND